MKNRAQKIRLGIFTIICLALLLVIIGFFSAPGLFEKKDHYYIAFHDIPVSGLQVGSPVKYLGIDVGSVTDIKIDPDDINTIIVRIGLEPDIPVKEDAVANIHTLGVTGLRSIEIRGGSQDARNLEPGGHINPGTTLTAEITGRAEDILFKLEELLNNLGAFTQPENLRIFTEATEKMSLLAGSASSSITTIDEIVSENRQDLRETVVSLNQIGKNLNKSSEEIVHVIDNINSIVEDEKTGELLSALTEISTALSKAGISELAEDLSGTVLLTRQLLTRLDEDIEAGSEKLNYNMLILQNTLENLNEASRIINADPSVLIRGRNTRNVPDRELINN